MTAGFFVVDDSQLSFIATWLVGVCCGRGVTNTAAAAVVVDRYAQLPTTQYGENGEGAGGAKGIHP